MNDLKVQIEKLKDTDPWTRDAFTKVDVKLDALRDSVDKLKERVIRVETAAIPK
jgi:hypothetical protein